MYQNPSCKVRLPCVSQCRNFTFTRSTHFLIFLLVPPLSSKLFLLSEDLTPSVTGLIFFKSFGLILSTIKQGLYYFIKRSHNFSHHCSRINIKPFYWDRPFHSPSFLYKYLWRNLRSVRFTTEPDLKIITFILYYNLYKTSVSTS